ncbi:MAG: hypothetical protein LBS71_01945 [Puniceicoccales bacterium]|jgi:hypothetical protein|nr:hypothetical protein [Puniceicoccales bacterium]
MKHYLLAHGFGFTNDYWNNLIPLLDGNVYYLDTKNLDSQQEYIGIGHSFGFLQLNNSKFQFSHLIGLQSFLNFCGNNPHLRKVIEPQLNKIIENYNLNANSTLKNFYEICGYAGTIPKNISQKILNSELEMMKKSYAHCGVKTLIIGIKNDSVVSEEVIMDNFSGIHGVTIKILDLNVNHTLGFHHSEIVADEIDQFIC